jgi:hypothetical protein
MFVIFVGFSSEHHFMVKQFPKPGETKGNLKPMKNEIMWGCLKQKTPVNVEVTGVVKPCETCLVTPKIQFSNQLWVAFKRMYELKALVPVVMLQPNKGELYKKYGM